MLQMATGAERLALPRNQSFFCNMIPSMTCDAPEEEWDEKAEGMGVTERRSGTRRWKEWV